ncbi:MAG: dihydroorotase [Candidatus Dormibacteria bacterium]
MNCILRGVRVIDPLAGRDDINQDVWLTEGRIIAIFKYMGDSTVPVIDLTPPPGGTPTILCPGFIDLHTHLREPGDEGAETLASGSRAAAAGGFAQVVAMANTDPPIDDVDGVTKACVRSVAASIRVRVAAALTRGLEGDELVDLEACAEAGAVAFTDDGRNAVSQRLLSEAIRRAARLHRPILVHPEDEEYIGRINGAHGLTARCPVRPVEAETRAVALALRALHDAGTGRLHLQHISSAPSIDLIREARADGVEVTAEVTPHHLAMWLPVAEEPESAALLKVNPPLRGQRDRAALIQALRDGVVDAVATDHAPHRAEEKALPYAEAAPGMLGLELALAVCLTMGGMGGDWIPTLVERLTAGPYRVLGGATSLLSEPRLVIGEAATCVLFDPGAEWTVGSEDLRSNSHNTPLLGITLRGRVLMTLVEGALVHHDRRRLPWPLPTPTEPMRA